MAPSPGDLGSSGLGFLGWLLFRWDLERDGHQTGGQMTGRSPISVPHHPAGRTEPQRGPESHRAGASRAGSGVGEVEGGQARGPSGAERVLMAGRGDGGGC